MAMVLVKVTATPDRIRYKATCAGAETAEISKATLLADCVAGPLKQYLTALADWSYPTVYLDGQLAAWVAGSTAVVIQTQFHTGPDGLTVTGSAAGEAFIDVMRINTIIQ